MPPVVVGVYLVSNRVNPHVGNNFLKFENNSCEIRRFRRNSYQVPGTWYQARTWYTAVFLQTVCYISIVCTTRTTFEFGLFLVPGMKHRTLEKCCTSAFVTINSPVSRSTRSYINIIPGRLCTVSVPQYRTGLDACSSSGGKTSTD